MVSDKYTRVKEPRAKEQSATDEEIRISGTGSTTQYVAYAGKVFKELNKRYVLLRGTGQALPTTVLAAEIIKRRIPGLHQTTEMGSREVTDVYEPIEEGLEKIEQKRYVTWMEIRLSLDDPSEEEKAKPGYQLPLDESEVKEVEDMRVGPKRESKDDDDEEGEDGEKKRRSKGKKGKGKKGKGKGKKGKGKKGGDESDSEEGEKGGKKGKGKKGKGKKGKGKKGKGKKGEDRDSEE